MQLRVVHALSLLLPSAVSPAVLRGEIAALPDGVRPPCPEAIVSLHEGALHLGRLVDGLHLSTVSGLQALPRRSDHLDAAGPHRAGVAETAPSHGDRHRRQCARFALCRPAAPVRATVPGRSARPPAQRRRLGQRRRRRASGTRPDRTNAAVGDDPGPDICATSATVPSTVTSKDRDRRAGRQWHRIDPQRGLSLRCGGSAARQAHQRPRVRSTVDRR